MTKRLIKVEDTIMAVLEAQRELATTEDDLKFKSGVTGLSFKEALIRLARKGVIVKWKNDSYVNYIVATAYSVNAYYDEVLRLPDIYSFFGHGQMEIVIKRSIPFVVLADPETKKLRYNRYLRIVA